MELMGAEKEVSTLHRCLSVSFQHGSPEQAGVSHSGHTGAVRPFIVPACACASAVCVFVYTVNLGLHDGAGCRGGGADARAWYDSMSMTA